MVSRVGQFQHYFTIEEQKFLVKKFGTTDKNELKKLMKDFILKSGDTGNFSLQDQLLFEKIKQFKAEAPLRLRKLKAQTEIAESKSKFLTHFGSEISESGSQKLIESTKSKYGFSTSQHYQENIQRKKNFYIDKQTDGTYIGCCRVCKIFATDVCSTSHEAEGDIELHLESVHQRELYQR